VIPTEQLHQPQATRAPGLPPDAPPTKFTFTVTSLLVPPILRPPPGPVATADFSSPEPVTHAVEVRRLAKR
jgi:hypothetical protein